MNFTAAVRKVSGVMTIVGYYKTERMVGGRHTKCTFVVRCTYDEDGEKKTGLGKGSVIILLNDKRGFDPTKAQFTIAGDQEPELTWHWDGDTFRLAEGNNETSIPVSATNGESSS